MINRLHSQMLQFDPCYQHKSGPLTQQRGVVYCQQLTLSGANGVVQTRVLIVHQLANQLLRLAEEIAEITELLGERVRRTQFPLLELSGVGEIVAARLIGELGTSPRILSAAALASLAGLSPVAVSSGRYHGHRLNRAIHVIALSQRRCNPQAQAHYDKKRAEGKTKRAAMRCLKRQLVNVNYRLLRQDSLGLEAAKVGLEAVAA